LLLSGTYVIKTKGCREEQERQDKTAEPYLFHALASAALTSITRPSKVAFAGAVVGRHSEKSDVPGIFPDIDTDDATLTVDPADQ